MQSRRYAVRIGGQLRMAKGEILPKISAKTTAVGWWNPQGVSPWKKPIVRIFSAGFLLAPFAWLLSNFFQLRGFVNLAASRFDLVLATVCLLALVCIVCANLPKWKWRIGLPVFIFICIGATLLDRATLPPPIAKASSSPSQTSQKSKVMSISLRQLFDRGRDGEIRLAPAGPFKYINKDHKVTNVFGVVLVDSQTQIYSLSFFVPASDHTLEISKDLANKVQYPYKTLEELLKQWDKGDFFEGPTPDSVMAIKHPTFSGKVFLYHETDLPLYQRAEIDRLFRRKKMVVEFRGGDYASMQLYFQAVKEVSEK